MEYTITDGFEEFQGTVSNMHGFVNRFLDTGFKTKWSGFWVPPYKFLDYYALEVNGTWLNGETLEKVDYGENMVFHHRTDCLSVKEIVSSPSDLPGFRVSLVVMNRTDGPKAVHTVLETGVDIRHKSNDVPDRSYTMEKDRRKAIVSSGDRHIRIGADRNIEYSGEPHVKEHFPGTRQVCFVPGKMGLKAEIGPEDSERIVIDFSTSDPRYGEIEEMDNEVELDIIGRSFDAAEDSLLNLVYDRKGKGIIAGHPWFQEYWSRDMFWSLLGLIDAGYFEIAHDILDNYASQQNFPNKILLEDEHGGYLGDDVPPLFIIAADKLKKFYSISESTEAKMKEAMEDLEIHDDVTVIHSGKGTWMDTLEREKSVEIQSLWLEAAKRMGSQRKIALSKGLDKFVREGWIEDFSGSDSRTVNGVVPLMFGHLEEDEVLDNMNRELITEYGAATLSKEAEDYNPAGYHTGSTWGLSTCWLASANLEMGRTDRGMDLLYRMSEKLDEDQPGAFPEVVNSETGENLGCTEQAWSAGMFINAVDSYLFGIHVDDGELKADPADGFTGTRKHKRFGDEFYTVRVEEGDAMIEKEE